MDVTMVLLIIFMATTPLLQMGYEVSLPRPAAGPALGPITVALDQERGVQLNGQVIDRKHLESRLAALLAGRSDSLVLFDAEDDVGYAHAVDILDAIWQLAAAWPPEGHEELPISAARADWSGWPCPSRLQSCH